jgi:hypothetical protein
MGFLQIWKSTSLDFGGNKLSNIYIQYVSSSKIYN